MFDFHMHSTVSFDAVSSAKDMVQNALDAGLREVCFTDHQDYPCYPDGEGNLLNIDAYHDAYDHLSAPGLIIRKGVEIGLADWNVTAVDAFLQEHAFDFVIGSVHEVDGINAYYEGYWVNKTPQQAFRRFMEHTLTCVKLHSNFDVLGHLTFMAKSPYNPTGAGVPYADYREISDEIMKTLAERGIGMEINTSALDRIGEFLPTAEYLRRFKELGGQIVTVGSDAHSAKRVGYEIDKALTILRDIFGYVCTFENRKPVFHKL